MPSMFLPITLEEVKRLGWSEVDIVIVSGDAYVDHPSFGTAVIGRTLEAAGYRVAIIPQPNWRDDLRDFRKFGQPRLFFGVTSGVMDSMVNHYTAARRLRHDDAYTPGGAFGFRPDYATYVYSRILKHLYPLTIQLKPHTGIFRPHSEHDQFYHFFTFKISSSRRSFQIPS